MTTSSAVATFHYFAFISYSHADTTWADWLHKALETCAGPGRLVGQTTSGGVIPKCLTPIFGPIFGDLDGLAGAHGRSGKLNQSESCSAGPLRMPPR